MNKVEEYCFFRGNFVPTPEANVNIKTHALQYGTACFGGIRGYYNTQEDNIFLFKIEEHIERLYQSAKILFLQLKYTPEELKKIFIELVQHSKYKQNVYLRPFIYKSSLNLSPRLHEFDDDFFVYVIPLDDYMDIHKGLKTCISSYRRFSDNQIPTKAKATGGYLNSALTKSEALMRGYDEGIFLDIQGFVSEGSAQNIFIVKNNQIITPDVSSSILDGITRKTIIQISKDLQIPLIERKVTRTELYTADEAFFSGTGVQIAWISSIDDRAINLGKIGRITKQLQSYYLDIVTQKEKKYQQWLTPIY